MCDCKIKGALDTHHIAVEAGVKCERNNICEAASRQGRGISRDGEHKLDL